MQCEICGNKIDKKTYVNVDGAILTVCSSCARFGTVVDKPKYVKSTPKRQASSPRTTATHTYKKHDEIFEYQLKPDFNKIIRNARLKKGLKQEELAARLNEKPSVISKIETGKFKPDSKLTKKLEKFLEINLMERLSDEGAVKAQPNTTELTLGDVITIKKRKKD
ncbi:MAG: multiprotein bridging factor aMBF1 [Candidatus Odinarchaeia archaeon]